MSTIAVIPVKANSERVGDKNFRPFSKGKSLFETKLDQVLESGAFDRVFVSSNSERAETYATARGAVHIYRNEEFCDNVTPWSEVIVEVVSALPVEERDHVAWCHVTSPLFDQFNDAVLEYRDATERGFNGLVAVAPLREFIVDEAGRPKNYHYGVWHTYSQNLEKQYAVTGALFIAKKREMLRNRYVVSTRPYLFPVNRIAAVDVDTELDFALAQLMAQKRPELEVLRDA